MTLSDIPSASRKGHRTLLEAFTELVELRPDRIWARLPYSDDVTQGFYNIPVSAVARAVDSCAHWLLNQSNGTRDDDETLAFIGVNDLRYTMMVYAALKCGKKTLLLSAGNAARQNLKLMNANACTKFFYTLERRGHADQLQDLSSDVESIEVAPFNDWVFREWKPFPFRLISYEEAKWDPVIAAHTSGSTGDPKPLSLNNGYFATIEKHAKLPDIGGRKTMSLKVLDLGPTEKLLACFPPYHLTGIISYNLIPAFTPNTIVMLGAASHLPNGPEIKHVLDTVEDLKVMWGSPSAVELATNMPGGIEGFSKLDYVIYTGGPMAPAIGDALSKHTSVATYYGSVEAAPMAHVLPKSEDWLYLEPHPDLKASLEPYGDDGTHEYVVRRTGDPAIDEMKGNFWTVSHQDVHYTNDLFVEHPTKPGLWKFHGRKDDVLLMSTGIKWNPVPAENDVQGHPKLSGALAVGYMKSVSAILLEPHELTDVDTLVREVQPLIDTANARVQAEVRIKKIAVVPPKSFVRAGKGTVVRKATTDKFADLIEKLCSNDA